MDKKRTCIILIALVVFALLLRVYPFLDSKLEEFLIKPEYVTIDRIIDGDTAESNGTSIRLLGINTPEKGEAYYSEAKEFLEGLILNETVRLEFGKDKKDKYERTLAYLYLGTENINKKLIEEGYANYYFPSGKDIHYNEFKESWEQCIEKNINLCESSDDKCSECIILQDLNIETQTITLHNSCNFDCELTGWEIKDEGRKKFVFDEFIFPEDEEIEILVGEKENTGNILYWKGEDYVWTDSGDTLFLRDNQGKLVLWEGY